MKAQSNVTSRPRAAKSRKAQALIEFALSIPVLLIFLGGAVDIGYFLWKENALTAAVREGAIFAARTVNAAGSWTGTRATATKSYMVGISSGTGLKDTEIGFTITMADDDLEAAGRRPDTILITITHTHDFLTPLLGNNTLITRSYKTAFICNTDT